MKKLIIVVVLIAVNIGLSAQSKDYEQIRSDFQGKHHMMSPDELTKENTNLKNFTATEPPDGFVRSIAEFEPNQGVVVSYLWSNQWNVGYFGIPTSLIKTMAEHVTVYILCGNTSQVENLTTDFSENDFNMENIEFVITPRNSYWTRDYSPWFIEHGNHNIGIIDFPYNRPRPDDNNIPNVLGDYFNLDVFGMNLLHTGGNYMTDGYGVAASCDLVYTENSDLSPQDVAELAESFLGVHNYYLVDDPLNDYIEHIDCWAKFLAPDKILITEVPPSDIRYDDFEVMADFWANQTSSYGYKYKVYRAYSPNGQPYTNSLIMNKRVYVPIVSGTGSSYNANALELYQNAMPGYEIIGIEGSSFAAWQSTDALHCRTSQVPDFEMLRIAHIPYFDTLSIEAIITIEADVYSLSATEDISHEVELLYRINESDFTSISMNAGVGNIYSTDISGLSPGDKVCYYIQATNNNNRTEMHPYTGPSDPHFFVIEEEIVENSILTNTNAYIKVFPNPVYDRFSIVVNDLPERTYILKIVDTNGRIIQETIIYNNESWSRFSMDMSVFAEGIYHIKLIGENSVFSTRFVKLGTF